MRIAHCSVEVQGVRGGGIGTYVAEAGRALRAAGHEVWLFTLQPRSDVRRQLDALDAFDRVVHIDAGIDDPGRYRFAIAREAYRASQLCHAALQRCGTRFDWIEFPDYGAWGYAAVTDHDLLASYGDTVLAVHLHSPSRECHHYNQQEHILPIDVRETCALEDEAIRRATLRLCPSRRLRELVADRLELGPAAEAAALVHYPMALPAEAPPAPRPRQRLDELRIAYHGRVEPRKGVHNLIEACRELPGLRLEVFGADGRTSPWHTSLTGWLQRDLPAGVTFRGALPRERLLDELRNVDVCVLPSLWDNWPNTCLEGMAAARVVVGGRHGGMSEMIEHGVSGFLVDGDDPADIARVLRDELGGALDRLDAIGTAAARRARALCDPQRYAARIEELHARHRSRRASPARPTPRGKVTFLIPYFREDADMVGDAVDSALNQVDAEVEVLVVDDGSPRPDKAEILDDLAARDPRVRVLSKPNGGVASARNHGIEHAQGEFVVCLDADNLARPEYAATGLEIFAGHPEVEALVPQFRMFGGQHASPGVTVGPLPFDAALAYFRNEFGDAGAMFRRSVFDARGLRYDPLVDAYSDWALWLDCARTGVVVRQVPRILYDYRRHRGSMMAAVAWSLHLPLVGLLIRRHWVPLDEPQQRELATAMLNGFGMGAILANLGGRAAYWERPTESALRLFGDAESLETVATLHRFIRRIPVLGPLMLRALRLSLRVHGRYKDWRQARNC